MVVRFLVVLLSRQSEPKSVITIVFACSQLTNIRVDDRAD